jgi:hypothetical protein
MRSAAPGRKLWTRNIGGRDHPVNYLAAILGLEIDRQRALVAVAGQKRRINSVAAGTEITHQIAARGLDLDHIRALVGQHHVRDRTRDHRCQIQDRTPSNAPGRFSFVLMVRPYAW